MSLLTIRSLDLGGLRRYFSYNVLSSIRTSLGNIRTICRNICCRNYQSLSQLKKISINIIILLKLTLKVSKIFFLNLLFMRIKKNLKLLKKKYDVHIDWIKFATIIKNAKSKSLIAPPQCWTNFSAIALSLKAKIGYFEQVDLYFELVTKKATEGLNFLFE